jgi:hypothetical protein
LLIYHLPATIVNKAGLGHSVKERESDCLVGGHFKQACLEEID